MRAAAPTESKYQLNCPWCKSVKLYVRNLGLAPEDCEQKHDLYSKPRLLTQPSWHNFIG